MNGTESFITWVMLDWRWLWLWIAASIAAGAAKAGFREYSKHRIALAKARAKARSNPLADAAQVRKIITSDATAPTPGECVHRNVVPVIGDDLEGKPVAWLCRTCDTRLPATWAVRQEDL